MWVQNKNLVTFLWNSCCACILQINKRNMHASFSTYCWSACLQTTYVNFKPLEAYDARVRRLKLQDWKMTDQFHTLVQDVRLAARGRRGQLWPTGHRAPSPQAKMSGCAIFGLEMVSGGDNSHFSGVFCISLKHHFKTRPFKKCWRLQSIR